MFSPFLIAFHYFSFPAHQSLLCLSSPSVHVLFPISQFTPRFFSCLFRFPLSAYYLPIVPPPINIFFSSHFIYFSFSLYVLPKQCDINVPFVISHCSFFFFSSFSCRSILFSLALSSLLSLLHSFTFSYYHSLPLL